MPVNEKYLANFEYENIYHVYNKTNNRELLFRSDKNYLHFLSLFSKYVSPFADMYAWNLLPTHFHLLIRVKTEKRITNYLSTIPSSIQIKSEKKFFSDNDINCLLEMEFKRFFTSYAMAFNNMFNRTGNLFYRTFKRVKIDKDSQFTQALIYIHANAQKHKLVKRFDDYKWTSYHTVISDKPTSLLRNEIIDWFGCRDEFIKIQHDLSEYYYSFPGYIEDDEDGD